MNVYNKTQTDLQIQRANEWLPVERGKREWRRSEYGIKRYKLLCRINKQQGYTVLLGKYSHYSVTTLNGV